MAQGVAKITGTPSSGKPLVCSYTDAESFNAEMIRKWEAARGSGRGIAARPATLSESDFQAFQRNNNCGKAPTRRRELEHLGAMTEEKMAEYQQMLADLEEAELAEQEEKPIDAPVTPGGMTIKKGKPTILSAAEAKEKIRKFREKRAFGAGTGGGGTGVGEDGTVTGEDVSADLTEDQRCVAAGNFWENGVCVQKRAPEAPKAVTFFEQYKTPIYLAVAAGGALLLWSIFKPKSKKRRALR